MVHTSCPPTPGLFSSLSESPRPGKWPSRAYAPSREHREPVLLGHEGGGGRLEITSPGCLRSAAGGPAWAHPRSPRSR